MRVSLLAALAASAWLIPGISLAQQTSSLKESYTLFPTDKTCVCVRTWHHTASLVSTETRRGKRIFQVFKDRRTKQELFRVEIGAAEAKLWNYGITVEGDFNGDGLPDYAWYGGDDSAHEEYVFLSSAGAYRRLDIQETIKTEWRRVFHSTPPNLRDSDSDYSLSGIRLVRDPSGLLLLAHVTPLATAKARPRHLRVAAANFVFSDK